MCSSIAPPLYNPADHQNPALTVDDGHFNAAGYRRMSPSPLGPVQAMVAKGGEKLAWPLDQSPKCPRRCSHSSNRKAGTAVTTLSAKNIGQPAFCAI